jgi:hypothetical protein
LLGSFRVATLARELWIEGFHDGYGMRRYIVGAVLMGFGAMLTAAQWEPARGGAVFALTAWLALLGMWLGAGVTDVGLDCRKDCSRESRSGWLELCFRTGTTAEHLC